MEIPFLEGGQEGGGGGVEEDCLEVLASGDGGVQEGLTERGKEGAGRG